MSEAQNRKSMIKHELPYPPSINNYYARQKNGAVYIKPEGKSYRIAVKWNLHLAKPVEGKIKLHVDVFPPDKKKRDLDNLNKCLLDSLQHAGIIKDDFDIDYLSMRRCEVIPGGKVIVKIEQIKSVFSIENNVESIIIVEEIKELTLKLSKLKKKLKETGEK